MDKVLDLTLRRKVRAKVGGRTKAWVSGGAPLNPEVGHLLPVARESPSFRATARPRRAGDQLQPAERRIRLETVGPPIKDTEVRIAEDGEIMVRGELVMHGYWRNPEETERVLPKDGWLAPATSAISTTRAGSSSPTARRT
jgi:long-chain acyl-CoA synthetase